MSTTPGAIMDQQCPQHIIDKMDDYLFDRLTPEKQEEVEHHYFGCNDCLHELQLRRDLQQLLKSEAETLVPDYFASNTSKNNSWNRPWQIASYGIAACLALFILSRLFLIDSTGQQFKQLTFAQRLSALETEENGKFRENPQLDSRLSSVYRSNVIVEKTTPDTLIYTQPQQFFWHIQPGSAQLSFIVVDNQMQEIVRQTVKADHSTTVIDQELLPGRYYWLLENDRETLHVGRFLVLPNSKPQN